MQRVLEMAEGIDVGEMPSYELVSSAEAKKRPNSSDGSKSKRTPWCHFYQFVLYSHTYQTVIEDDRAKCWSSIFLYPSTGYTMNRALFKQLKAL